MKFSEIPIGSDFEREKPFKSGAILQLKKTSPTDATVIKLVNGKNLRLTDWYYEGMNTVMVGNGAGAENFKIVKQ